MIQIEQISKSFKELQAISNISLEINDNEVFGVIGPDGAGKSTLFRIITTLLLPDSGTVHLNGYDVVKDYRKIRNRVGYMPGRFSLYADLSVEENLNFYATVFGTSIKENYQLIKDVYEQIEPFKKRLAGRLSGGMKQKLALSCALIHRPEVLVLDEPTTGVDAVSRKEFWDLLKGLKDHGITILVSTPYMDEAQQCDRISLIQNGQIMRTDHPKKINESYPFTLYSVQADNNYQLINDLSAYAGARYVFPFGQEVHYTDQNKNADLESLKSFLVSRGNKSLNISEISADTEDVFMHLMQENETDRSQ